MPVLGHVEMAAPCGWTIRDNRPVFDGVRWAPRGTVTADPGRGVKGFALVVVGRQDEDVLRRVLGKSRQRRRGAAGAGAAGAERLHDIHRHVLPAPRRGGLPLWLTTATVERATHERLC